MVTKWFYNKSLIYDNFKIWLYGNSELYNKVYDLKNIKKYIYMNK